nr:hypothetical protein L321_20572 [Pseudomonas plecoglossicida NB2011]
MVLVSLFAFAVMGSASATPLKVSTPARTIEAPAVKAAENPWPDLASVAAQQPETLLAHDERYEHDHYRHDGRGGWRREEWRREQWRREQARRDWERHRDWERRHERAMQHRYDADHRYYRR